MKTIISAKRKNDAVITVCQDNNNNCVKIEAVNKAAERLTGYLQSDLLGKDLDIILPENVKSALANYLDFEEMGNDLAAVLRKIPNFHILNKEHSETPVNLKVFHVVASHAQESQFELLMRDVTLLKQMEQLKQQILSQQEQEVIHKDVGIADLVSVRKNLELVNTFVKQHDLEVCFTLLKIDKIEDIKTKYGHDASNNIIQYLGQVISESLREGDIIGYMGGGVIGVMLFDCNVANAKVVLNRLRMLIEAKGLPEEVIQDHAKIPLTMSVGFIQIKSNETVDEVIKSSELVLSKAIAAGGNRIYEG